MQNKGQSNKTIAGDIHMDWPQLHKMTTKQGKSVKWTKGSIFRGPWVQAGGGARFADKGLSTPLSRGSCRDALKTGIKSSLDYN